MSVIFKECAINLENCLVQFDHADMIWNHMVYYILVPIHLCVCTFLFGKAKSKKRLVAWVPCVSHPLSKVISVWLVLFPLYPHSTLDYFEAIYIISSVNNVSNDFILVFHYKGPVSLVPFVACECAPQCDWYKKSLFNHRLFPAHCRPDCWYLRRMQCWHWRHWLVNICSFC